jgi:hypothetical protein
MSILSFNGGCSTEIIAGLPVMFYREHEFINIYGADNFKRGLGIKSCYILVYFHTVKDLKKTFFLYPSS